MCMLDALVVCTSGRRSDSGLLCVADLAPSSYKIRVSEADIRSCSTSRSSLFRTSGTCTVERNGDQENAEYSILGLGSRSVQHLNFHSWLRMGWWEYVCAISKCVCEDLIPDFHWQYGQQGRHSIVALDFANRSVRRGMKERTGLTSRSGGRPSQAIHLVDGFDRLSQPCHKELLAAQGRLALSRLLASLAPNLPYALSAFSVVLLSHLLCHIYLCGQY